MRPTAFVMFLAVCAYNLQFRSRGRYWALGYSFLVHHVCEFTLARSLLATKRSSRARSRQQNALASRPSGINIRAGASFNAMRQEGGRRMSKREKSDDKMRRMERKFEKKEVGKTTQAII